MLAPTVWKVECKWKMNAGPEKGSGVGYSNGYSINLRDTISQPIQHWSKDCRDQELVGTRGCQYSTIVRKWQLTSRHASNSLLRKGLPYGQNPWRASGAVRHEVIPPKKTIRSVTVQMQYNTGDSGVKMNNATFVRCSGRRVKVLRTPMSPWY